MIAQRLQTTVAFVRNAPVRSLVFLVELYRTYVSPTRMPTCRFTPTCSEYAVDSLREWGVVRGLALTVVRLAKCAPWHPGGWDPVPQRKSRRDHKTDTKHHSMPSVNQQRST
ncbi:membrane protein insertion efficiency factor YidD [Antrihabitans sp. NCIMB 15449]|jgi:uncharacterized protein|uniref:Putative membrane protein insertion efficiency factor n=1 Tax=Antrihabitans spumae TaxID=3373370 RepID=A0ABW7JSZ6_9NOCA